MAFTLEELAKKRMQAQEVQEDAQEPGEAAQEVQKVTREVVIETGPLDAKDPKLDWNSPEFDEQAWAELYTGKKGATTADVMRTAAEKLAKAVTFANNLVNSLKESAVDTARFLVDNIESLQELKKEVDTLGQYLQEELQKPEYEDLEERDDFVELLQEAFKAARLAKLAAEALPQLQSTGTPKYYTSTNTALINALQANDGKGEVIGAGPIEIPVLNVNKENEVTVYAVATLENMDGIKLEGKPFEEYDRAVHDAVVTLYDNCIKHKQTPVMTADMVYRTMIHKTNTEKVSQQQRELVTKSIDKMRKNIYVYADASAEMKRRGVTINGKPIKEFKIDNFMINADKTTIKAGGEEVEAFILRGEPIMLNYAKLTGQLITVKGSMLDIKVLDSKGKITTVSVNNNEKRIAVKSYLLRRVEVMRNDEKRAADALRKYESKRQKDPTLEPGNISDFRKQNHVVLFETLFNSTGITAANSQTKTRDYVFAVLDYWKASGDIKGYKKRRKGKTIDAVVIEL